MARHCPIPNLDFIESDELWENMKIEDEKMFKLRVHKPFDYHPTVMPRMRAVLLDWLSEVSQVYKLRRETYFLAMDYLDRFLSQTTGLPKSQLQLLGITCLFIASKVEEIYPPKIHSFSYVTDSACSNEDIVSMEALVLKVLNWELNPISVNCWVTMFMQLVSYPKKGADMSKFFIPQFSAIDYELAIQLCNLAAWDEGMFLFSYRTIAAASMYFVFDIEIAVRVSGLTLADLKQCINWLKPFAMTLRGDRESLFNADNHCVPSKTKPWVLNDEIYAMQKHTVTIDLYDQSQQFSENQEEDNSIDSNSTIVHTISEALLSPPPSQSYFHTDFTELLSS